MNPNRTAVLHTSPTQLFNARSLLYMRAPPFVLSAAQSVSIFLPLKSSLIAMNKNLKCCGSWSYFLIAFQNCTFFFFPQRGARPPPPQLITQPHNWEKQQSTSILAICFAIAKSITNECLNQHNSVESTGRPTLGIGRWCTIIHKTGKHGYNNYSFSNRWLLISCLRFVTTTCHNLVTYLCRQLW